MTIPPHIYEDDDDALERRIERHFAKLSTIGKEVDGSISRIAFSDQESAAMAYVRAEGEAFGLAGRYDGIGNLLLSTPGDHQRRILVGSHLDSVPKGGNYDGAAGVIAALEALRGLVASGAELARGIDLVAWRGEEYTYNAVYKGSATAFGLAEPHVLHNLYLGQSLRDAIMQQGFDPSYVDECRPSFDPAYIDSLDGFLELHIEQGIRLERDRKDVGVVTGIAGDRRFLVVLEGRFDHSGATPMGAQYRADVNLAMAHILTRFDELGERRRAEGHDFTQTVGIINADPETDRKYPAVHGNSVTKVSGLGYFTLDFMSSDDEFLDGYSAEVLRMIWQTAKELGTNAVVEQTDSALGVQRLDAGLQDLLAASAEAVGASHLRMASGAGHDAALVTQARRSDGERIPVGMLFIPCKAGISHSKDEYCSPEQVARGTEVLRESLLRLSS
jgi:N-carbamoyl-L-amino-acid hydrolase